MFAKKMQLFESFHLPWKRSLESFTEMLATAVKILCFLEDQALSPSQTP